jgi:hypothetical protein
MRRPNPISVAYAFWPRSDPPSEEAMRLLLDEGAEDADLGFEPGRRTLWSAGFLCDRSPYPVLLWAAPNEDMPETVLLDAERTSSDVLRAMRRSRWHLGVGFVLEPGDPVRSWTAHVSTCAELCPELTALFDANACRIHSGDRVRAVASGTEPARPGDLYVVHVVVPERARDGLWLHTHGLERTGLPDVELLDVLPEQGGERGELLTRFVDRCVLAKGPPPRSQVDPESGLRLSWVPLAAALRGRDYAAHGGRRDRAITGDHDGRRIVLVPAPGQVPAT